MGRALDAVETFESIVVDTAADIDDKIKSLYHKGISLQMLGSIEVNYIHDEIGTRFET